MGKTQLEKSEATNNQINSNTKYNSKQIVEKANEGLEWLPDGWNVEFRTRKSGANMGYGYKCYTDPHGKKFYSKVEVLRYLETIKGNDCTSKKEEECNTIDSSKEEEEYNTIHPSKKEEGGNTVHSPNNDVAEKSMDEDLPPGWIKEVRVRKGCNRKDMFYTDPASGYVFRSKKDVLRYLESGGDISSCAIKPNKRQIQDEDKLTPTSAGKKQKLKQSATKRQLFVGKEISDDSSSGKRKDMKVSSGMTVAPVPTDNVQGKNVIVMEKAGKKNCSNSTVSKNKEFNGARRSSRRFAGVEPEQLTDNLTNEQTLQVPKRNLRRDRTVLDTDLANKSSQQPNGVLETGKIEANKPDHPHDSQGLASEAHLLKEKLLVSETGKTGEMCSNSNKTSNKKDRRIPCRASKRLAGSEPEQLSNSLSQESALEYKSKKSKGEGNADLHPRVAESAVELVGHASMNGGSSNKSRKPPKTYGQLEKHVNEEMNDEKSEPQQSFAFHYSWSDPSLEFAIKTLTSALPAEDLVANRPIMISETDKFSENKSFENVKGRSNDKNPTTISETDKFPENKSFENVKGSSSAKNPKVNSSKSKNKKEHKKELKVPTRLSKRLAGGEPEVLPAERALEYSTRKSCKDKPNAHAISTNGASGHLHAGKEESKLIVPASDKLKTSKCGESSNGEKSCDAQTVPSEQLQRVDAKNMNDERLQPQFSQFGDSWSDPCLEFAFKTLTGALPADAVNNLPVAEPDVIDPPDKELIENVVQKSNEAAHDNSNHYQTKEEPNTAFQPIQLLGQPELRASSTSCENDPKFATRESCSAEGNITRKLDGGQSLHTEAGNVTQIDINSLFLDEPLRDDITRELDGGQSQRTEAGNVTHIDINSLFLDEPSRDNMTRELDGGQSLHTEAGNVTQIDINSLFLDEHEQGESIAVQPQPETETTNQDNSEREYVSFMDAWSDPCLEFAFKTLTGAIPVEDNMAGQGCFQEPANRHDQRDGSSTLPEVGPSSISQSDKSVPGQQASMSSPFLSLSSEKSSSHGCTGVDTQEHYSHGNNKFQW